MQQQRIQQQHNKPSFKWRKWAIAILTIFVIISVILWNVFGTFIGVIISTALTGITVLLALYQWLAPFSPAGEQTPALIPSMNDIVQAQAQEAPFDMEWLLPPKRFIGHEEDLQWLLRRLRGDEGTGITVLRGMGGIGKTTLVAISIQQMREQMRFPDGIVVFPCQDTTDIIEILSRILTKFDPQCCQSLNHTREDIAAIARRTLKEKMVLIILDNVTQNLPLDQIVSPLLAAGASLLLTTQQALSSPYIPHEAIRMINPLPLQKAQQLFTQTLGWATNRQPTTEEKSAIQRIVSTLEGHPLAIRLTATYAVQCNRDLPTLAHELEQPHQAIQVLQKEAPLPIYQAFSRSIETLPSAARHLLIALSAFPTPIFSRDAALDLAGAMQLVDPRGSLDLLLHWTLMDASPIESLPSDCHRERLRIHSLLRASAHSLFEAWPEEERLFSCQTIAEHYLIYARRAPEACIAADEYNIVGMIDWAYKQKKYQLVIDMCVAMRSFWQNCGRAAASLHYLPLALKLIAATPDQQQLSNNRKYAADLALAHGQMLELIGKIDDAESAYQHDLQTRRDLHDRKGEGVVLRHLGKLAKNREHLQEAIDYCQQAFDIANETSNADEKCEILRLLGEIAQIRGLLEDSRNHYQQALTIARNLRRRQEGGALRSLGEVEWWAGDKEQADTYFKQALDIAREEQNWHEVGWLLAALTDPTLSVGQKEETEQYLQLALKTNLTTQNRGEEGWVYFSFGKFYHAQGQILKAEEYYQRALTIAHLIQNWHDEPEILCCLGDIKRWLGNIDLAEKHYQQALTLARDALNRQKESRILFSSGQFALERGRLTEAENALQEALHIVHDEIHNIREEVGIRRLLGDVALMFEHYPDALERYQEGLTIAQRIHDRRGEGELFYALGVLALNRNQLKPARHYFSQSLAIARAVYNRPGEGKILYSMGELALLRNQLKQAEKYLKQALDIARETCHRREEGCILILLGYCAAHKNNPLSTINRFVSHLWPIRTLPSWLPSPVEPKETVREYYQAGLRILQEVDDAFTIAHVKVIFARWLNEQSSRPNDACLMFQQAIAYFAPLNHPYAQRIRRESRNAGCPPDPTTDLI